MNWLWHKVAVLWLTGGTKENGENCMVKIAGSQTELGTQDYITAFS
jgi:hypothetical protein